MSVAGLVQQRFPAVYVSLLRVVEAHPRVFVGALIVSFGLFLGGVAVVLRAWWMGRKYRRLVAERAGSGRSHEQALCGLEKHRAAPARWLRDGPLQPLPILEFTDSLGLRIAVYSWMATTTRKRKGVAILLHGQGCWSESEFAKRPGLERHLGYRGSWIEALNDAGWDCWSFDYTGHGHSESVLDGARSMAYAYDDYVDEAVQLRALLGARSEYADASLRWALLGQSMGACVGLLTAERIPTQFDRVALCSPALRFEDLKKKPRNRVLLPLLDVMSVAMPSARIGSGEPHCNAQIHEEMHALGEPYFDMLNLRARYCAESLTAGERALANAEAIEAVPLLIIHDPADKYTDPVGSAMLHARLPESSTLLPARGAGHDVVSGDTKGVFIAAIVAFFATALDGGSEAQTEEAKKTRRKKRAERIDIAL